MNSTTGGQLCKRREERDGMGMRDAAIRNLDRAMRSGKWRRPRPRRSREETYLIKRLVWLWFNHRGLGRTRESIHSLSRALMVSRSYIQKLVRGFKRDPREMQEWDQRRGPAHPAQLARAQEETRRQRERGLLRGSGKRSSNCKG